MMCAWQHERVKAFVQQQDELVNRYESLVSTFGAGHHQAQELAAQDKLVQRRRQAMVRQPSAAQDEARRQKRECVCMCRCVCMFCERGSWLADIQVFVLPCGLFAVRRMSERQKSEASLPFSTFGMGVRKSETMGRGR